MIPRVYSVTELANELKSQLETAFASCWVRGEVTGAKKVGSGHIYFTLKDKDAQISCAWFSGRRTAAMRFETCNPVTGEVIGPQGHATVPMLVAGGEFFCSGTISFYPARGSCQLVVNDVLPSGDGLLAQQFLARKATLEKLGYFSLERKRKLPVNPRRVALVTSESGAAIHDFLRIAKNRGLPSRIRLFPSLVQGKAAAKSLAQAIDEVCQQGWAEVLVLIRGGGSLEDLWCFNEKEVADAVFHATIPVLAGIGHEVDFTLADLTADVRAATPTHAAELLWPLRSVFANELSQVCERLQRGAVQFLETLGQRLDHENRALHLSSPENRLRTMDERLINATNSLINAAYHLFEGRERALFLVQSRLRESMAPARMDEKLARLAVFTQGLWQHIVRILERGEKAIEQYETRLVRAASGLLEERERVLFLAQSRLRERMAPARMDEKLARLALLSQNLWQLMSRALDRSDQTIEQYETRLVHAVSALLDARAARLEKMTALLSSASPLALLGRGYAVIEDARGDVVRSAASLSADDRVYLVFQDGRVLARIEEDLNHEEDGA